MYIPYNFYVILDVSRKSTLRKFPEKSVSFSNYTSTFKTPTKQTHTSFRTPIKSDGSFVTPIKRTSTCAENENCHKKPKLEENIKGMSSF